MAETNRQNTLIKGYFMVEDRLPEFAPETLLVEPTHGRYAEVLKDGIVCLQIKGPKVASYLHKVLVEEGTVFRSDILVRNDGETALLTRFYFSEPVNSKILMPVYNGILTCAVKGTVITVSGYMPNVTDANTSWKTVYDNGENFSPLPQWLFPVKNAEPVTSGTSFTEESEWFEYTQGIFNRFEPDGKNEMMEAYEIAIGTSRILNKYFRKNKFLEARLAGLFHIMEFNRPSFYQEITDERGYTKTVFSKSAISNFMIHRYNMKNIEGLPHVYNNGVYTFKNDTSLERMVMRYMPESTAAQRAEIRKTIFSLLGIGCGSNDMMYDEEFDIYKNAPPNLIAFKNGVYNLDTNELMEFKPDLVITNRVAYDYSPDYYENLIANGQRTKDMEMVDNWLDSFCCGDESKKAVLLEASGLCLYRSNIGLRHHNVILTGKKETGKSTVIQVVELMVGKNNVSHIALENICNTNDRFSCATLPGKLLNTAADINGGYIPESGRLKALTAQDGVQIEDKGKSAYTVFSTAKHWYGCNDNPVFKDQTGALLSRFEIIKCEGNFANSNCIPRLYEDYLSQPECMKYFTWLSVEGLRRFIVNGFQHTYCESNEKIRRMYEHVSNPIKGFLEWEEFPLKSWIGQIDTKQVLVYYNTYLREELMLPDKASKTTLRNLTTMLHENGIEVQRKNMPNGQKRSVYRFINPDDWEVYDEPNGGDNKINNTRDNKTSSSQVYNHSEDSMTTETTGLDNYADFFPDGYEQSIQDNDNFFENLADDSDDISESEVLESQIDMSDCDYVPNNTIGYESHEDYEFMDIPDEDDYFKNAKW